MRMLCLLDSEDNNFAIIASGEDAERIATERLAEYEENGPKEFPTFKAGESFDFTRGDYTYFFIEA